MRLAVIGNGPAAVGLLSALESRREDDQRTCVHATIFAYPDTGVGAGHAFAEDSERYLLNTLIPEVYIDHTKRYQFQDWLLENGGLDKSGSDSCHATRTQFGQYLQQHFNYLKNRYKAIGWEISVCQKHITRISTRQSRTQFTLFEVGGEEFDAIALCTGSGGPANPYGIADTVRYVKSPYPASNMDGIEKRSAVFVLGTNLTACDAAIEMISSGHRGEITLGSRRGILPSIRRGRSEVELKNFNVDKISSLYDSRGYLSGRMVRDLLLKDIEELGGNLLIETQILRGPASAINYFTYFERIQEPSVLQSIVQSAEVKVFETINELMNPIEFEKLRRRFNPAFRALQCPMPASSAHLLSNALSDHVIRVIGGVDDVRDSGQRFAVTSGSEQFEADYVIDATRSVAGFGSDSFGAPLIQYLIANEFALLDQYNAIKVDAGSNRVATADGRHLDLYAIGEITRGNAFYSSSLPEIVRGASRVATSLLRDSWACESRL